MVACMRGVHGKGGEATKRKTQPGEVNHCVSLSKRMNATHAPTTTDRRFMSRRSSHALKITTRTTQRATMNVAMASGSLAGVSL